MLGGSAWQRLAAPRRLLLTAFRSGCRVVARGFARFRVAAAAIFSLSVHSHGTHVRAPIGWIEVFP
jgi:hypothetical protein